MSKKWYSSKTLWVNAISLACLGLQSKTGYVIAPELQMELLGIINVVLRVVTKDKIDWR